MTYVFPLIGFVIGLGPGFLLARRGQVRVLVAVVLAGLAMGGWIILESRARIDSTDPLGFGIILLVMIAPVLAGLMAGGIWGRLARTRGGRDAPRAGGAP
jgi:positive regulator of sigma E activity